VTYLFDFGDGSIQTVRGLELSHMTIDMTMYAETTHSYNTGQHLIHSKLACKYHPHQ